MGMMNSNRIGSNLDRTVDRGEESSLDFYVLWKSFASNWKWFLWSVISFLLIAGLYLWLTPSKVNVMGKVQIVDKSKDNGNASIGMAMLNSLPMGLGNGLTGKLGSSLGSIETEEEILMSNTLVRDVINQLRLHTEYRLCRWGRKDLLYQNQPICVSLSPGFLDSLEAELPVHLHQIVLYISKDSNGFTIETTLKRDKEETDLPILSVDRLPATVKTDRGTLMITENTILSEEDRNAYKNGYDIKVSVTPPTAKAAEFMDWLTIEPTSKKAPDMMCVTLQDENVLRGIDFLDTLVDLYNKRTNDEKNEEAKKTDDFVREQK